MSKASVVACDGCATTAVQDGAIRRPVYPAGWLRLSVSGRRTGAPGSTQIVTLDICSPRCAPDALKDAAEAVAAP